MSAEILNRLPVTLDLAVEALAICEVRRGIRLVGKAEDAVSVHSELSGDMHLWVDGAPPLVCRAGSMVLIPQNRIQRIAADAAPKKDLIAVDHWTLARDGLLLVDAAGGKPGALRLVCGHIPAKASGSFGLFNHLKIPIVADLGNLDFARCAYAAMRAEIRAPKLGTRALLGALMKACLVPVIRQYFAQPGHQSELLKAMQNPRLMKVIHTVMDAPAAAHGVSSLACIAGMSRSTFAKEFVAAFHMTPMEFVAKTRLQYAAELLRATTVPVKVIASSSGFASRSHFSRTFRETYGTDPTQFRAAGTAPERDDPSSRPDAIVE